MAHSRSREERRDHALTHSLVTPAISAIPVNGSTAFHSRPQLGVQLVAQHRLINDAGGFGFVITATWNPATPGPRRRGPGGWARSRGCAGAGPRSARSRADRRSPPTQAAAASPSSRCAGCARGCIRRAGADRSWPRDGPLMAACIAFSATSSVNARSSDTLLGAAKVRSNPWTLPFVKPDRPRRWARSRHQASAAPRRGRPYPRQPRARPGRPTPRCGQSSPAISHVGSRVSPSE